MIKIDIDTTKNLLAFSGGVDSTALFFILLENNIPFDIAIVDYNLRDQSKLEVQYAKTLAKKYDKKCFHNSVKITSQSAFEKNARDIRYEFFDEIITKYNYNSLITAHQLNDKLEWFMMQLTKGAGLLELIGLQKKSFKNNYIVYRPLLEISKQTLEKFLLNNKLKYFIDESNSDEKYTRNYFRNNFTEELIKKYEDGIRNSFEYLNNDINSLNIKLDARYTYKDLEIFNNLNDDNLNIKIIDKSLKKRGLLISKKQRYEILKEKELTISHKINIAITDKWILICPKSNSIMKKEFKELCRVNNIPKNIRAYLFEKNIDPKNLF